MARKRASMREGPLAELFRATEAAQRQEGDDEPADEPLPPAPRSRRAADADPGAVRSDSTVLDPASRRQEAALEETVEHVHDFDAEPPTLADAPATAAEPAADDDRSTARRSRRRERAAPPRLHRDRRRSRRRSPSRRTSRLRAGSSSRCPRAPRGSTSVARRPRISL